MMNHFPVFFCNPTSRGNTDIQDWTDGIRWNQGLSSVCLFTVVISFLSPSHVPSLPSCLFTSSSAPHLPSLLPRCTLRHLSFPLLISLSSIHPTQCSPAPIDPLIEISAQQAEAQREMLFRGNFRGAGLRCRFLSSKLSCQWNWVSDQADIMRM